MTVQRRQKPFTFKDGSQVTVWQASWDMSMERREIEEQALLEKAKPDADPELVYFQEMIYAPLGACSTGDVPDLQTAFHLSPEDLDGWFQVSREMNVTWYEPGELIERVVSLSDGSTLTVLSKRPSVLMRRFHLEADVDKQPALDSVRKEVFRVTYYPKLAGCSIGNVPSMEEARSEWGEEELQHWYDGALEVIPEWFLPLEQIVEQNRQRAEESTKKKSRRRAK